MGGGFYSNCDSRICLQLGENGESMWCTTDPTPTEKWLFVVATYDGLASPTSAKIWINGEEDYFLHTVMEHLPFPLQVEELPSVRITG